MPPALPEHRTCEDCGKPYLLPIPYDQANEQIRNKCLDCIKGLQRDQEVTVTPQGKTDEWY
jgi:hypothetical protein